MTGLDDSQPLPDEKALDVGRAHPRPHEPAPDTAHPEKALPEDAPQG